MPIFFRKSRLQVRRPLKINTCETADPQFLQQLEQLKQSAASKKKLDPEILQSIGLCIDKMKEIHSFCHEYDYANIPANGYRTILLCARNILEKGINKWNHKNKSHCEQFKQILKALEACIPIIDHLRQASPTSTILYDTEFYKKLAFNYYNGDFDRCLPLYDKFRDSLYTLQAAKIVVSVRNLIITVFSAKKLSLLSSCLSNQRYFSLVDYHTRNVDINIMKFVDKFMPRPLVRGITRKLRKSSVKYIQIPSQNQYEVRLFHTPHENASSHSTDVRIVQLNTESDAKTRAPHKCLLMRNNQPDGKYSNCLLLHIHGGAFVFGSPEIHILYNSKWADAFPGGVVLVPEFGLAPKYKFPQNVQVFLDIYFWLTRSSASDQLNALGTTVDKLIILGDSSGALVTTALTLVLNDLRHGNNVYDELGNVISQPIVKLPMPTSLFLIYPAIAINIAVAPSHLLMPFHFLVTPNIALTCTLSYVPNRLCDSEFMSYLQSIGDEEERKKLHKLIDNKSPANSASEPKEYNFLRYYQKNPLYPNATRERVDRMFASPNVDILNHPYVTPLHYANLHQLYDVPLIVHAVRTDLWIDPVVELMKKWPGHSSLYVMDDLCHSYLTLFPLGGFIEEAVELVITQVKEQFDSYQTFHRQEHQ